MDNKVIKINGDIKQVRFGLENCESILIPFECFKEFYYDKDNNEVISLYCTVKDNSNIDYVGFDNSMTPIQRLAQNNDITHVNITYEDGSSEKLSVNWFDDYNPDSNESQVSELINYSEIHIQIRTKLQTLDDKLNKVCSILKQSYEDKLELEEQIRMLKAS